MDVLSSRSGHQWWKIFACTGMVASYLVDLHFSHCKQNLFKDENQQYVDQTNN